MATHDSGEATLSVVSLNVAYDPRVDEQDVYHFNLRWPAIQEEVHAAEVILFQEVHEDWLPRTRAFAAELGHKHFQQLYHTTRMTYLVTLVKAGLYSSHAVHQAPGTYTTSLAVTVMKNQEFLTLFNVHLPLDLKVTGERLASTVGFINVASTDKSVILGDWNTLPGMGDTEQLELAGKCGRVVPWTFEGGPETTVWGYPAEATPYQQYNTPSVLDRLFVHGDQEVLSAVCRHKFIQVGGQEMAISDHLPCHVVLGMSKIATPKSDSTYKALKRAWLEIDLLYGQSTVPVLLEAVLRADIAWRLQEEFAGTNGVCVGKEKCVFEVVTSTARLFASYSGVLKLNGGLPVVNPSNLDDNSMILHLMSSIVGTKLEEEFSAKVSVLHAPALSEAYRGCVLQLANRYALANDTPSTTPMPMSDPSSSDDDIAAADKQNLVMDMA